MSGWRLELGDVCCVGYAIATAVLLVIKKAEVPDWQARVAVHTVMVAGALVLIGRGTTGVWGLLRLYYPGVFFVHGYLEMDVLQPLIWGGYPATAALARADLSIFGAHPTVVAQRFYGRWLDEVMSLAYLSYYAVPFIVTVPWLRSRRPDLMLWGAGVASLTYVIAFAVYLLVPAEGPRRMPELRALHHAAHAGPVLGRIVRAIEGDSGAVAGGVFPSLHVGATTAWAMMARRVGSPSALPWACALGMVPAVVYLGYHHAVDAIAGLALGAALPWAVPLPKAGA